MNIITSTLCKKPAIGVAMWLMTLCTTNQALQEKFIDLSNTGILLHEVAQAPMNEQYRLVLLLKPNDNIDAKLNNWQNALCTYSTQNLRLTLHIRDLKNHTEFQQTVETTCPRPNNEDARTLLLGSIEIKKGEFDIELSNNTPLDQFKDQKIQVLLMGENVGFP